MDFTKEKIDFYLKDTHIENMFINEYMPHADGNYVKVYIFALMYADQSESMSNDTIAKHLNLEVEDVLKAWNYWEKQGVIRKTLKSDSNPFDYIVEFISLKQLFATGSSKPEKSDDAPKRRHSPKDVESAMRNKNIKEMFDQLQSIAGRPFEGNEMFEILDWIDHDQLQPDLIIQAYSYCVKKKNNSSFKYIASVIRSWRDNHIKTSDDLSKHMEESDQRFSMYKRILKALGLHFRYPTEEERRIIDTWFDEWHLSLETILEACKKTSGISNPNINYINSILRNWQQKEGRPSPSAPPSSEKSSGKSTRDIFDDYEKIRNENEKTHENRRFEIYKKIPRIKSIDEEISKSSISISKYVLNHTSNAQEKINKLRKYISELNQEKAFLLTENNYPANYMDMIYQCEVCKDTGLLSDGEKCACFKEKLRETS